jgi:dUTP pyrophosphatase
MEINMQYRVILEHGAKMPTRNKEKDSGIDLRAKGYSKVLNGELSETIWFDDSEIDNFVLMPGERVLIKTGVKIAQPNEISNNYEILDIQVRPRSGLALKHGITILNSPGTVDNGYRNDIGIILYNTDKRIPFIINNGDRVAQMIISSVKLIHNDAFIEVDSFEDKTDRGESGFGDSGVK